MCLWKTDKMECQEKVGRVLSFSNVLCSLETLPTACWSVSCARKHAVLSVLSETQASQTLSLECLM